MVTSVSDVGEAAIMRLALKQGITSVCIDEWKERRMALAVGLTVTGVIGLLGKAKRQGIVRRLGPSLTERFKRVSATIPNS
jgi:predicted nucleic acid-binding protein